MTENKTKMDPWQLITIIIILAAIFCGLYVSQSAIDSRLDSIEQAISGNSDSLKLAIERVDGNVKSAASSAEAAPAAAAEEAPAEAAEEAPAEEAEEAPAEEAEEAKE